MGDTAEERAALVVKGFGTGEVGYVGLTCVNWVAEAIRAAEQAARAEEREECARVVGEWNNGMPEHWQQVFRNLAAAIRGRSN